MAIAAIKLPDRRKDIGSIVTLGAHGPSGALLFAQIQSDHVVLRTWATEVCPFRMTSIDDYINYSSLDVFLRRVLFCPNHRIIPTPRTSKQASKKVTNFRHALPNLIKERNNISYSPIEVVATHRTIFSRKVSWPEIVHAVEKAGSAGG